jgi:hypothetical protein
MVNENEAEENNMMNDDEENNMVNDEEKYMVNEGNMVNGEEKNMVNEDEEDEKNGFDFYIRFYVYRRYFFDELPGTDLKNR